MKQISIITINYNNASGLEKTIRSVVEQTYNEYEYIPQIRNRPHKMTQRSKR